MTSILIQDFLLNRCPLTIGPGKKSSPSETVASDSDNNDGDKDGGDHVDGGDNEEGSPGDVGGVDSVPSSNIVDGGVNVEENDDDDETHNEEDENDDESYDSENDDDNNSVSSLEEDDYEYDESDDECDTNDESLIVMKKSEDSAMKSNIILGNTFHCLAKFNKGPNSKGSPEDTEHYKKLDRILKQLAKLVDRYIEDNCTVDENGSLRYICRAMRGTESKEPGVYRAKDNNGRVKTG